jgi:hypothetical protein
MSTGQLRVRVRAYDREQAWAPPYVANELAGTRQAAQQRRNDAVMRTAEADAAGDGDERDRLHAEAEQATALADALDERVRELEAVDEARAHWYAHTAETRAAADRARAELSARQADADPDADEPEVTPAECVARYQAQAAADDPYRVITDEHELVDVAQAREHDQRTAVTDDKADANTADRQATGALDSTADRTDDRATDEATDRGTTGAGVDEAADEATADPVDQPTDDADTPPAVDDRESTDTSWDIRQEAAAEPARDDGHDPDAVRVPSSDETAESVRRAQRALTELKQRQAIEDRHAADEARDRDAELAHWREDDHAHDASEDHTNDRTADRDNRDDHAADHSRPGRRHRARAGGDPL